MTPTRCSLCGRDPAEGYAFIDDDRFCHGEPPGPEKTCYETASHEEWWSRVCRMIDSIVERLR